MKDLIERQAAIDAVVKRYDEYGRTAKCEELASAIEKLPSAQPEPLTEEEMRLLKKLRSFHNGSYAKLLDKLVASAQPEQQWIPCSEQEYPSDNREVEVTCEFTCCDGKKVRYTCHASYVHRYSIESMPYDNWIDCEEYNEEKDMYYALPGWYERVHNWDDYSYCAIKDRVVAWRELPEPWRGEENG